MENQPGIAAPRVSAVIVTWNARALLSPCIDSLLAQDLPANELEILIVDNGSNDDTLAFLAVAYPGVTVVALDHNLGFAGGANAGIRAAAGEVIVLLNNDAVADPAFVRTARDTLLAEPGAGAVTGWIILADRYSPSTDGGLVDLRGRHWKIDASGGAALTNSTGNIVTGEGNGLDRDWLVPVDALTRTSGAVSGFSGGAVALRRAALDAVGLLDERYFMYYEDTDLSWRLRAAGWTVLFSRESVVHHAHAASSGTESWFFLFHNERNRILFALKNAPAGLVAAAFARTIASAMVALVRLRPAAAARKLHAVGSALRLAPSFARDRRAIARTAVVGRAALAAGARAD